MAIRIHEFTIGNFDRGALNALIPSNFTSQTAISAGATSEAARQSANTLLGNIALGA